MSREQILDSILNRGQARLTIDDLNQSPIREGEHVEVFSHEERLETFMDILEYEEKSERWASGITTYQISQLKMYQAKTCFVVLDADCEKVMLKKSLMFCTVCLKEIENMELVRELPCLHKFHKNCIDPWLKIRASCPIDRKSII